MDILDDLGVSKFSAKVFLKVNYSFNIIVMTVFPVCLYDKLKSNQIEARACESESICKI